jgi:chromosome partitioning protein
MAIITLYSPKGGAGKTTTALVLGTTLAADGYDIVMIDADPNASLSMWTDDERILPNLEIIREPDEEELISAITTAHTNGRTVIVDLDGRASTRSTHALLMSDLVLVPFRGSMFDADMAVKAQKTIKNAEIARGRAIAYRGVLTNAPASYKFYSRELTSVLQLLKTMPFPVLETALAERQAYRALISFGGPLGSLDPRDVPGLETAKANADALAAEIIELIGEPNHD